MGILLQSLLAERTVTGEKESVSLKHNKSCVLRINAIFLLKQI
jgi:hypothetical protein